MRANASQKMPRTMVVSPGFDSCNLLTASSAIQRAEDMEFQAPFWTVLNPSM